MAKILLVDDDVDFTAATSLLLKSRGHEVTVAPNGDEGLEKARKNMPDLILLDVMMRSGDEGFEFATKFKQDPKTAAVPVILLTGITRAKGLPFSFEPDQDWLPVNAVLDKPVKPEALFKAVEDGLKS
jgi:two-component system, OmpR family, alkaline phosphatase synthesis response regulator PhoP